MVRHLPKTPTMIHHPTPNATKKSKGGTNHHGDLTMTKTEAMRAGAKQSWARAHKLAGNAEGTATGAGRPSNARTYLAEHPEHHEVLDSNADKRSPKIRAIVDEYAQWCKDQAPKSRPAKGDPTRPARAGAPKTGHPRSTCGKGELTAAVLFDLRAIQKKHGLTCAKLAEGAQALGTLIDE